MKLRYAFIILAATASFVTGCGKDDDKKTDPTPTPTTGTVKGSFTPAAGASMVYLITGTDTTKITPTSTGTYEKTDVKAGTYSVTVKTKEGYSAPAPTSATVTVSKTTEIPVITLTQLPANGLMSFTLDGTAYSQAPNYGPTTSYVWIYTYITGYQVHISLPQITGTGVYSTSTHPDMEFRLMVQTSGASWMADDSQGSATINVTAYNPTTKKGNATFSFTGVRNGFANKVITNGTFQNIRLKN